jgi:hypothetical protein
MKKALTVVVAVLIAALAQFSAPLVAAPAGAGTVKVTIHYTGKGRVDASHKLWVWVFDSPNIGPGSMPLDQISIDKNDTDAVFQGVGIDKVYIAAAFDESGSMMGDAPPPTGTPIGILSGDNGAPIPVTSGAKDAVALTFNDNFRMP